MLLAVRIYDQKVHSYHPNGQHKMVGSHVIVQPLEITQLRKIGFGGGCCYEGMDMTGRWHMLYKSDNPGKKIPVLTRKHEPVKLPPEVKPWT